MAIILDTDVIIRGEKGIFDLRGWVASRTEDQFEVAAITIAELWHGVERASGTHRSRREQYLRAFLTAVPIIAYTEQTAYLHARIWADLLQRGKMIGYYDIVLAATALERGSTVATFNRRHFDSISGLRLIEPTL
jgi:predicted nucleic acid-binding protein